MAEHEKVTLPTFNLGIEESQFTDYGATEDFLNDTPVEKIEPKEEKKKELPKEEKKVEKEIEKEDTSKILDGFLGEGEEGEEEEEGKEKEESKEETDNDFATIAKTLYETGVLTPDDDEEPTLPTTPEELLQSLRVEGQKIASAAIENFLGKYGEDYRDFFDAIFVNGVSPRDYMPVYNEIQDLNDLDLENESTQESLVRSYYEDLGWSKEKINNKVDKLKAYSDLEDEAKTVHPIVVDKKNKELAALENQKKEAEARKQAQDVAYKTGLTKLFQDKVKEKNFDGIPLTPKDAEETFKYMYEKKYKTPNGEFLSEFDVALLESKKPENLAARIKVALLYKNNFDFSKIEKKTITKESNQLFNGLKRKEEKKSNTKPAVNDGWNI